MSRYENRVQLTVALVIGLLLAANLFTLTLVGLAPASGAARVPVLLVVFVMTTLVSVPAIVLLPRWLMRPFRQLVYTAESAPLPRSAEGTGNEAEFVLETFQAVIAKLQAQSRELERLNLAASTRAQTAEAFSERIIASIPSGLIAFDGAGRVTIANAPAEKLLGDYASEANGGEARSSGQHGEATRLHGRCGASVMADVPELLSFVERCIESGEVFRREEVDARSANGTSRKFGVTVAPVEYGATSDAGEAGDAMHAKRGALCLLTDLTEVARLREQIVLKKNLESLGEMSAGLSHEFKNALATLHGYAQLILNATAIEAGGAPDTRTVRVAAQALLVEVRGLGEMVTAFLDFARLRPLQLDVVSLQDLIGDCVAELRPLYDEREVALCLDGEFPIVAADERLLRQAVINILRNAAEAIDYQTIERRVMVNVRAESGVNGGAARALIEIRDTGAGIPPQDIERIFIPFFSTKPDGHGVGLALAHRIITHHGGHLSVANSSRGDECCSDGGGAVFTIRLPA